ncbi:flagellar protein FlaG [Alcaligenes endophyticus]|uniref:Flagellar protein FlaG n=1 Tax=Alcaligenes endophyticus TaxID=1929088 RepID=A0ABT8EL78_9BURK|nr:flagellar protein FlaG [Alcaligenes endophyticus]MCX5590582.1 flagellar protein FlaG [Alcaligenes endophyticus]MDN4122054.1 flagellar protein FlaG [Alcaligenes endophyticus]
MITPVNGPQASLEPIQAHTDAPGQHLPINAATKVTPTSASDTQNQLDKRWPEKNPASSWEINSIDQVLKNLNSSMDAWATGMRFDMDEDAQRLVVSIIDNTTGEVLRTVPSDAVIQIAKMIVQLQGQTVNVQA